MDHESDEALLRAAKQNPEGIGMVYDKYADKLYGFCLKRCSHKELAEDFVSKVFIKFIEHVPTMEWQGVSIGAWLFRVASNQLIDYWRAQGIRMDESIDQDEYEDIPSKQMSPDEVTDLHLEREKLLQVMQELSPRDQGVLDLRFFAGLDAVEIAQSLDLSSNHASVLVYRALQRLRTKYQSKYGR